MNKEENEIRHHVKKLISDFLGIEIGDMEDDFSLTEDLHMKPTDLTDFFIKLSDAGFNTDKLDIAQIETLEDLIDELTLNQ